MSALTFDESIIQLKSYGTEREQNAQEVWDIKGRVKLT